MTVVEAIDRFQRCFNGSCKTLRKWKGKYVAGNSGNDREGKRRGLMT
jgi:hypothetical protein